MRRHGRWSHLLAAMLLVGCGSTATPSASQTSTSPTPAASPGASDPRSSAEGSATEAASPESAAPSSSQAASLDEWTGAELFLLSGVAGEIRPACARAAELPADATAGVQCHPEGIAAIGYYLFNDRATMRERYFERLAEFGVEPNSGEVCRGGEPGEGADSPGTEGYEYRIGCYVDSTGAANVRMAFPAVAGDLSVYVGAAGENDSIAELTSWLFPPPGLGATGCNFCIGHIWSTARSD